MSDTYTPLAWADLESAHSQAMDMLRLHPDQDPDRARVTQLVAAAAVMVEQHMERLDTVPDGWHESLTTATAMIAVELYLRNPDPLGVPAVQSLIGPARQQWGVA